MEKVLPKKILIAFSLLLSYFLLLPAYSIAATLNVTPSNEVLKGRTDIVIGVDPEGAAVSGVDAVIKYEPDKLEVELIQNGSFEQYLKKNINKTTGVIEISAFNSSATVNSVATVATITVKPLVSQTTTFLNFDYTAGSTTDSNVASGEDDVLSGVVNGTYTLSLEEAVEPGIGSGGNDTQVPEEPTPSAIPKTGSTELPLAVSAVSIVLIASGAYLFKSS